MYNENEYQSIYQPGEVVYQQAPMPAPRPQKKRKKKGGFKRILTLVVSAAIFGGVAGGAFYGVNNYLSDSVTTTTSGSDSSISLQSTSYSSTDSTSQSLDVTGIASSGLPSVVAVTNISVQEVDNYFGMFGRNGRSQTETTETTSCGSGVIIYSDDSYLYMVTNYHVIEDATTLSVTFADDETYEASLYGYNEDSDIALLTVGMSELSSDTISQIAVATCGDSDSLLVGEQVVAIGNALGYGQSVTTGIVSAVDRTISDGTTSQTYIQTTAAINPGNSGGALFNMDGELVGISTAKISSTDVEGMGYAIPISTVLETIDTF
ncbi:MAG: trypsin-like peptidase domain-containing protein [Ruminococcus sp.]|nr:trypsin-like peptidase domain-containing protein [Ruminococcus sp.]